MSVTVRIPTQLRRLSANASEVQVEAGTVAEALKALEAAHPGFAERLFDETGGLRRFVNVFLADEDIRFLQGRRLAGRPTVRRSASSPPSPAAEPRGRVPDDRNGAADTAAVS